MLLLSQIVLLEVDEVVAVEADVVALATVGDVEVVAEADVEDPEEGSVIVEDAEVLAAVVVEAPTVEALEISKARSRPSKRRLFMGCPVLPHSRLILRYLSILSRGLFVGFVGCGLF